MQGFDRFTARGPSIKVGPLSSDSKNDSRSENCGKSEVKKKICSTSPSWTQRKNSISVRIPGRNRERGVSTAALNSARFDDLMAADFASGFQERSTCLVEVTFKAAAILDAQSCNVWMIDNPNRKLYTFVQSDDQGELKLTKELDRGITASVISDSVGFNIQDVRTSMRWSHDVDEILPQLETASKTVSYLAWPMWDGAGGECIGVVEFRNKNGEGSFNAADSQLARIVASQLGHAIVHCRQQEIIAGRDKAINKAYEAKSHDAEETICIKTNSEGNSREYGSLSTPLTSLHASFRLQEQQKQQQRVSFAISPHSSLPPNSLNSPPSSTTDGDERDHQLLRERGWEFNAFECSEMELIAHAIEIFDETGLLTRYSIPVATFTNFLQEIISGYRKEAPYHNHFHAFDVLHVCFLLVTRCKADEYLESFNILSVFIAALAHDLGHDGYNNNFHATTQSELAVTYNGVSILENNSAAQLFRILKKEDTNILERLCSSEAMKMRSRLIDLILDTDPQNHFMLCTRFKHGMEMKELPRGLLSSIMLHAADVSNPSRPGSIARKWAYVVQEEFFRQGDSEKDLNLPHSPFTDRQHENLPRMQGVFIDGMVSPVFKLLSDFLPAVKEQCIKPLQLNRAFWKNMEAQNIVKSSEIIALLESHQTTNTAPFDLFARPDSYKFNELENDDESDSICSQNVEVKFVRSNGIEPIPGIPATAVGLAHADSLRKMSLIYMNDCGPGGVDRDPELGRRLMISTASSPKIRKRKSDSCRERQAMYRQRIKTELVRLLESNLFQASMLVATIYALFAADLNQAIGNKDTDGAVDAVTFVVLLLFIMEMLTSIICIRGYLHFFFWLDLVATISLAFEIEFLLDLGSSQSSAPDQLSLAKASRAAKVGARAGRLVRLLRLVKLVRIGKALKWTMEYMRKKKGTQWTSQNFGDKEESTVDAKMSVIGQRMTESITKKVIIAVMLMLIVFALMDVSFVPDARQVQLDNLAKNAGSDLLRAVFFDSHDNIVQLKGAGDDFIDGDRINQLRTIEMFTLRAVSNFTVEATFDLSEETEVAAWYSFGSTLMITFLLGALSLMFSRDAYEALIRPIEHMKETVTQLSQNPLLHLEKIKRREKSDSSETEMIEGAINKMATLLQIGFGTAGAEIIAKSLSDIGELDPMVPGQRVHAIFGFCDVRDFTFATEGLQQDVMLFVNKIAAITHRHVVDSGGAPNKNIGDAFLFVWKLASSKSGSRCLLQKHLFDGALLSMQKIIVEIRQLGSLAAFLQGETDDDAAWRSTLENFKVTLGFGLHTGWAIEGSIGSKVKIDASYLSPHVNLASRLEAATKRYRVPLLMSEAFVSGLTGSIQKCCRKADRVTFKGSSEPMTIFHYDDRPLDVLSANSTTTRPENFLDLMQATSWDKDTDICHQVGLDVGNIVQCMRSGRNLQLREVYDDLFNSYVDGKWSRCRILCHLWMERFPVDVLVHVLVEYLARYSFECPESWSGYHPLTEK